MKKGKDKKFAMGMLMGKGMSKEMADKACGMAYKSYHKAMEGEDYNEDEEIEKAFENYGEGSLTGGKLKMKGDSEEDSDEMEKACWDGYKQIGMKDKDGKKVPNCVPELKKKAVIKAEKWITIRGRKLLINDTSGEVIQGGDGMADGKDIEKIDSKKKSSKSKESSSSSALTDDEVTQIVDQVLESSEGWLDTEYDEMNEDGQVWDTEEHEWQDVEQFASNMLMRIDNDAVANMENDFDNEEFHFGQYFKDKHPKEFASIVEGIKSKFSGDTYEY
jgi:hypothetical protein